MRITPPRVIPDFAQRSELLDHLETENRRLIYVVAPPGFGKSVLASQWMARVERGDGAGVWIAIDPFESDLQFMVTAVHAFRRVIPHFADGFDSERLIDIDIALSYLDSMIDELAKFKREIRLVIDSADHFGVTSSAIAQRFIARLPKNVKVMVIRERSPITSSLGTLGMNDFAVVTVEDLRLNPKEVVEVSAGKLTVEEAERVIAITNGWPAATRIVVENLNKVDLTQGKQQLTSSGSLASITRKAIARLEECELQLLRSLSLVPRISNQVALALSEDDLAPMMLAKLSAESFFLTRVISTPTVYEMNQLIRDALREDLAMDLTAFSELHTKTFDALYRNGAKDQAFALLAESGNAERIRRLVADSDVMTEVTKQIRDAIYQGDIKSLESWATALPFLEGRSKSLSFSLDFYIRLLASQYDQARALLVERNLASDETQEGIKNAINRLSVIIDFFHGDFRTSIEGGRFGMENLKKNPQADGNRLLSYTSFLRFAMSSAFFAEDFKAMKEIEEFIDETLTPDPSSHFQINALLIKTMRAYAEGRYRLAESFAFAAISYADQNSIRGVFAPFEAYFALMQIFNEQCRFEEAERLYRIGIDEARRIKNLPWLVMIGGRHAIASIRNQSTQQGLSEFQALKAELPLMRSQEIDEVNDRHELIIQHLVDGSVRKEQIRSRMPRGHTAKLYEAQSYLRKNAKEFEKSLAKFDLEKPREELNAYVFLTIQNFDYPPKAREYLAKALSIAQEHGFYQYFLIQGDRFLSFLISASTEIPSLFLERLAKDASERLRNKMTSSGSLPVPLTKREADILRHLASDQPLAKISANLNITKNTMKTHLRHLYRKLGATDRSDAVEKGRALLNL